MRLVLWRHAKAAHAEAGQADHARPLTRRGRRDAARAGDDLRGRGWGPDRVLVSPATRTQETARWGGVEPGESSVTVDALYGASFGTLQAVLAELPPDVQTAWIVGHNPGLETAVTLLSGEPCRMRTATAALLSHPGPGWADAVEQLASWRLHDLHTPPRED